MNSLWGRPDANPWELYSLALISPFDAAETRPANARRPLKNRVTCSNRGFHIKAAGEFRGDQSHQPAIDFLLKSEQRALQKVHHGRHTSKTSVGLGSKLFEFHKLRPF